MGRRKKAPDVEGYELTSGFWWEYKREDDKIYLKNSREQTLVAPIDQLSGMEMVAKKNPSSARRRKKK